VPGAADRRRARGGSPAAPTAASGWRRCCSSATGCAPDRTPPRRLPRHSAAAGGGGFREREGVGAVCAQQKCVGARGAESKVKGVSGCNMCTPLQAACARRRRQHGHAAAGRIACLAGRGVGRQGTGCRQPARAAASGSGWRTSGSASSRSVSAASSSPSRLARMLKPPDCRRLAARRRWAGQSRAEVSRGGQR